MQIWKSKKKKNPLEKNMYMKLCGWIDDGVNFNFKQEKEQLGNSTTQQVDINLRDAQAD